MRKALMMLTLVFAFMLTACAVNPIGENTPPADEPQEPAPTKTPEIIPAVALVSGAGDSRLFFEGLNAEAEGANVHVKEYPGDISAAVSAAIVDKVDGMIALYPGEDFDLVESAANKGVSVVVYDTQKHDSDHVTVLSYDAKQAAEIALTKALEWPPHETSVRLIGMFSNEESDAANLFSQGAQNGMIFPKETYYGGQDQAADWFNERLEHYFPGMMDAVYAENAELALTAKSALKALGRDDMEVFCAQINWDVMDGMMNSEVLACAVGANDYYTGAYSVRAVSALLDGGQAADVEFAPYVMLKQGFTGPASFMSDQMKQSYPLP
jgi:ABC-type sugar transport system substrate-binding protein